MIPPSDGGSSAWANMEHAKRHVQTKNNALLGMIVEIGSEY